LLTLEYVENEAFKDNLFQENDIDVFTGKIRDLGAIFLDPTFPVT